LTNGVGNAYNLTTFLGAANLRTLFAAKVKHDILDETHQDGPFNLLEPAFNLTVGYCSGNYEAWGASGKKYEAQIVIFCILLAIHRFSWISWKVKSR
jgi:hypothetical protein